MAKRGRPTERRSQRSQQRRWRADLTPGQIDLLFYIGASLLCLLVYQGLSDNYLYNDDFLWLSAARHEMSAGNVLSFRVIGFFRPLVNVSFWAMESTTPGNIGLHYSFNILLHLCNTLLVYHLLRRVLHNRMVAMATAVYFLVTSTHASAVLWISARTSLMSTFFLLLALVIIARPRVGVRSLVLSVVCYVLALASKETAVVGVFLLGVMYLVRSKKDESGIGRVALVSYAAVVVVYLVVRYAAIGRFAQDNWGLGAHMVRNLGGGVLYEFYPWSLGVLFGGIPTIIAESTHPFWPEVLALPVVALFGLVAWRARLFREMAFALAWTVAALLPVALLKLRFFSTVAITHDRYYYLSSVGACLAVVLLLWMMWRTSRLRTLLRPIAVIFFIVICVGETVNIDRKEKHAHMVDDNYRFVTWMVTKRMDESIGLSTCVIERSPMRFSYLKHALRLERPRWRVEQIATREEALAYKPCLYVAFFQEEGAITTVAVPVK